jgi:hypothetical protein
MLAVVAACALSTEAEQRPAAEEWRVVLQMSGGFAGVQREIDVSSTGEVSVADRRRGTQLKPELRQADLMTIASLVANAQTSQAGRMSACADCFEYHIDVRVGVRRIVADLNDGSLASSGLEQLVRMLVDILNRTLS